MALARFAALTVVLATLTAAPAIAGAASDGRTAPAAQPPTPAGTVSPTAAPWTPEIISKDSTVRQLVRCGDLMYAVGDFGKIRQGPHKYVRHSAFSFDVHTGHVTRWNPDVRGQVNSIALSPDCSTAYLGGVYDRVHHHKATDISAVSTSTGHMRAKFGHTADGAVETLLTIKKGTLLLVGGAFHHVNGGHHHRYYTALNANTGRNTRYVLPKFTGKLPPDTARTMVFNQQLAPDGSHLLLEGTFTAIGGHRRLQLAQLDLGAKHATLNRWHNRRLNHSQCSRNTRFYARDAAYAPNEKTIYLAATGHQGTSPFCDSVVAFTDKPTAHVRWINSTGGDSLYSVLARKGAVYIGGHERWADNKGGLNTCMPGCKHRPGIGAISPTTGLALTWNPTRDRGHGADDMVFTAGGLWVASDNYFNSVQCAGAYHPGICFLPRRNAG